MDTKRKNELRKKLIQRIKELSDDKLGSLEAYLNELESDIRLKSEILAFSGIFKNLDKDVIDDLTINLEKRRLSGSSRIQE